MGVKFGREYNDIVEDLTTAIEQIENSYDFLEMSDEDWNELDKEQQTECLKTLADDVFFALGTNPRIQIGQGFLVYEKNKHIIKVNQSDNLVTIVNLV
jgi:hypothetical protein